MGVAVSGRDRDASGYAFPVPSEHGGVVPGSEGLTKREFFAALALQGLLANPFIAERCSKTGASAQDPYFATNAAESAVAHADALLEDLAK